MLRCFGTIQPVLESSNQACAASCNLLPGVLIVFLYCRCHTLIWIVEQRCVVFASDVHANRCQLQTTAQRGNCNDGTYASWNVALSSVVGAEAHTASTLARRSARPRSCASTPSRSRFNTATQCPILKSALGSPRKKTQQPWRRRVSRTEPRVSK